MTSQRKKTTARFPTRAIVLAAGLGQRMDPLSRDLPKPAMPLHGNPLLWHTFRHLAAWGVTDILVNLHHGAETVLQTARAACPQTIRLTVSYEPLLMNTGGSLSRAAWFLHDDPVWIVNGDIYFETLTLRPFLDILQSRHALAALWMHPERGPRTVRIHDDGRIRNFSVKTPGQPGTLTFCGVHLVAPRILDYLPANQPSSIIQAYRRAIRHGDPVYGIVDAAPWSDLGTPAGYLDAHRIHPPPRAAGRQPHRGEPPQDPSVVVGRRVRIDRGCRLTNCILWDDVHLLPRTVVRDTIIGRNVTVGGVVDRPTITLSRWDEPDVTALIQRMGWQPEATAVTPLAPRGSGRAFLRIRQGHHRAILIRDNGERRENRYSADYAAFLRTLGLPVPECLAHDRRRGLTIMRDGGDRTLTDIQQTQPPIRWLPVYRQLLGVMAAWHHRGADRMPASRLPRMPRFSPALFQWELQYFDTHYLQRHARVSDARRRALIRELRAATQPLHDLPQVLVHRDLQSSNILAPGRSIMIIDFQGMRLGPAVYDLASLLYDPYVTIDPDRRLQLLEGYRQAVIESGYANRRILEALRDDTFHRAALQRLAQALGAYARLGAMPPTRRFLQHIPAALRHMRQAAESLDGLPTLVDWLSE